MRLRLRRRLVLASASLLPALPACALIGGSVTSVSDSVAGALESASSPFESSSTSLGSQRLGDPNARDRYRRDVRAYTVASLTEARASGEFLRGIAGIAEAHGITDWEGSPETLAAIEDALADGGARREVAWVREELAPVVARTAAPAGGLRAGIGR